MGAIACGDGAVSFEEEKRGMNMNRKRGLEIFSLRHTKRWNVRISWPTIFRLVALVATETEVLLDWVRPPRGRLVSQKKKRQENEKKKLIPRVIVFSVKTSSPSSSRGFLRAGGIARIPILISYISDIVWLGFSRVFLTVFWTVRRDARHRSTDETVDAGILENGKMAARRFQFRSRGIG